MQKILKLYLQREGFTVSAVSNGREAIDFLAENHAHPETVPCGAHAVAPGYQAEPGYDGGGKGRGKPHSHQDGI